MYFVVLALCLLDNLDSLDSGGLCIRYSGCITHVLYCLYVPFQNIEAPVFTLSDLPGNKTHNLLRTENKKYNNINIKIQGSQTLLTLP